MVILVYQLVCPLSWHAVVFMMGTVSMQPHSQSNHMWLASARVCEFLGVVLKQVNDVSAPSFRHQPNFPSAKSLAPTISGLPAMP